jgi:DNA-binding CsgD family transcriptional regulator/MFS family permease
MGRVKVVHPRLLSAIGCSLFFAYILSFPFEGQVLYSLFGAFEIEASGYLLASIFAHLLGLFSCGYFVKARAPIKRMMMGSMGLCAIATIPFFFGPSGWWMVALLVVGYASGCVVASFGFLLKTFTPKSERLRACADILIFSNMIMIVTNVVALHVSPAMGLALSLSLVMLGMVFVWLLPASSISEDGDQAQHNENKRNIKKPTLLLSLFVLIITINSGLMYQVINPAFEHLTGLVSWYWAVPYIGALIVMRNLPPKFKRSGALYVGMAMIVAAFISFMMLARNAADYLVVDTLMLGACGIFDLFWWSILGEILDYTDSPVKVFGMGLAANVLGVLVGDVLGMQIASLQLSSAEVTVIALTIVATTVALLPALNRHLVMLLKNHAYLMVYDSMGTPQQNALILQGATLDPLTVREQEVLKVLLEGKSNREIAYILFISESTVKTHVRNIYSKYDVRSRAQLISTVLKNEVGV